MYIHMYVNIYVHINPIYSLTINTNMNDRLECKPRTNHQLSIPDIESRRID